MARRFEQFKAVIDAWERKDGAFVLDAMTDDVVWHYAAAIAPPARGKAEAAALIERFAADMHAVEWTIVAHAETADRLFVEGTDAYDTSEGQRVAYPYAGVIDFRGEQICGWRDYVDARTIERLRAGKPRPDHIEDLIAREAA
ncbi:nuclear transport factor 2 family protein [Allosphingosinicella indica]|uniref:Limonene-1,2-epoxide hydrolase n=1 Tax=Allosphingosinicella indica TaxID=941907 RepID=A0A1X7GK91_9SPHN|nr:limonene-1,2-epoxide hydrolase family protein [Allosphingosinicella indica]SMF71081.1 Limonene-1,2-epoxide hydrolase [Allosphingosinicella indica]